MDILKIIVSGFFVGLISALPVGVSALEIIRRGVDYGFFAAFFVALGTVTSDVIYSGLAYFGVSKYILDNPLFEKIAGIAEVTIIAVFGLYILFEARSNRGISLEKLRKKELPPYLSGIVITIFNPLNLIFWAGVTGLMFKSQIVDGNRFLGGIFLIAAILGILVWTFFLSYVSAFGKFNINLKLKRILNQIVGILLILAAAIVLIGII